MTQELYKVEVSQELSACSVWKRNTWFYVHLQKEANSLH